MNNITITKSKSLLLFYAIGSVMIIPIIGRLTLSEALVALSIPFLSYKTIFSEFRLLKGLFIGFTILFLGQVLSDIINNSAINDYSRGWALLFSSFFSTIFLVSQLSKHESNIQYYILLVFLIQLFFGYDGGGIDAMEIGDNYFKFRFAPALNMLTILLSCYYYKKNKKNIAILILLTNIIISILFAARSNGLIFIVSSIAFFFKVNSIQINWKKIFRYSLVGMILLYSLYVIYANQVINHDFGGINSKKQFALMTNIYNPFELLKYGRTDFFVTLQAIFNKPIFGHGSWAKDVGGYYTNLLNVLSGGLLDVDTGYIPIHSILLGAWATSGIIGLIGIIIIFSILFKKSISIYLSNTTSFYLPLIIILSVEMCWTFLFSPLSALRSSFPLFAAVVIIEYQKLRSLDKSEFMI